MAFEFVQKPFEISYYKYPKRNYFPLMPLLVRIIKAFSPEIRALLLVMDENKETLDESRVDRYGNENEKEDFQGFYL